MRKIIFLADNVGYLHTKVNFEPYLTPWAKLNSKEIVDLNMIGKTMKLRKKTFRRTCPGLKVHDASYNRSQEGGHTRKMFIKGHGKERRPAELTPSRGLRP